MTGEEAEDFCFICLGCKICDRGLVFNSIRLGWVRVELSNIIYLYYRDCRIKKLLEARLDRNWKKLNVTKTGIHMKVKHEGMIMILLVISGNPSQLPRKDLQCLYYQRYSGDILLVSSGHLRLRKSDGED